MPIRAKFRCTGKKETLATKCKGLGVGTEFFETPAYCIEFVVAGDTDSGHIETNYGSIMLCDVSKEVADQLEVGAYYFFDFTKA